MKHGDTGRERKFAAGLFVLQSRIRSRMNAGKAIGCNAGSSDAEAPIGCSASPEQNNSNHPPSVNPWMPVLHVP